MTAVPPDPRVQQQRVLRLAVQNLAAPPQAQRRYVQLGWLRRAIDNFLEMSADRQLLVATIELDDTQIALLEELRAELSRRLEANPDLLEDGNADTREYLFTHALENDQWHSIRHLARRCYTAIAGDESPFIAIMAR